MLRAKVTQVFLANTDNLAVIFAQVLSAICGFLFLYVAGNYISKDDLGRYFFFFSLAASMSGIISAPLGMWLTRSVNNGPIDSKSIVCFWILICIACELIGISVLVFFSKYFGITIILSGFLVFIALYSYSWNSTGRKKKYAISAVCFPAFRIVIVLLGVLVLAVTDSLSLLVLTLLSATLAVILLSLIDWRLLENLYGHPWTGLIRVLKDGLGLLKYMTLSSLVFMAYQFSDKLIIKELLGYEGVANLAVLMQWSYTLIALALQPLIALAYPSILQADSNSYFSIIFRYSCIFAIFTGLVILAQIALSEQLLKIIPAGYSSVVEYLWIGSLAAGLFMIGQVMSICFSRTGNEKYHLITVLFSVCFGIYFMCLFALWYGFRGAIYGHLAFSLLYFLICLKLILGEIRDGN